MLHPLLGWLAWYIVRSEEAGLYLHVQRVVVSLAQLGFEIVSCIGGFSILALWFPLFFHWMILLFRFFLLKLVYRCSHLYWILFMNGNAIEEILHVFTGELLNEWLIVAWIWDVSGWYLRRSYQTVGRTVITQVDFILSSQDNFSLVYFSIIFILRQLF